MAARPDLHRQRATQLACRLLSEFSAPWGLDTAADQRARELEVQAWAPLEQALRCVSGEPPAAFLSAALELASALTTLASSAKRAAARATALLPHRAEEGCMAPALLQLRIAALTACTLSSLLRPSVGHWLTAAAAYRLASCCVVATEALPAVMHVAWRAIQILTTSPRVQAAMQAHDGPCSDRLQKFQSEFKLIAGMAAEAAAMGLLCLLRLTNPGGPVAGSDSPELRQSAALLRRTTAKPASIVQAVDQLSEVLASTRAFETDDCKEQDGFVMLVDMLAVLLQTDARSEGHCCEERVLLAERPQLLDRLAGMLDDSVRHQLARPTCVSAARLLYMQQLLLTQPLLLQRAIYSLLGLRGSRALFQLIGQRLEALEEEQAVQPAAGNSAGTAVGAAGVAAAAAVDGVPVLQRVLLAGATAGLAEAAADGLGFLQGLQERHGGCHGAPALPGADRGAAGAGAAPAAPPGRGAAAAEALPAGRHLQGAPEAGGRGAGGARCCRGPGPPAGRRATAGCLRGGWRHL
ncbi:hypothetical protein ABPG75_005976 [Micractinium tetrahymenae]